MSCCLLGRPVSSANRGREREKDDLYETSFWLIEALVPRLQRLFEFQGTKAPYILEPCAGNGRIVRVLKHYFPKAVIHRWDINPHPENDRTQDFLQDFTVGCLYDLIISNPPFMHAEAIIQKSQMLLNECGKVIMLERANFLGSKQREPWLRHNVPSQHFSPRRPSFLPTRLADSIEYSWMEWGRDPNLIGTFQMLDTIRCDTCKEVHYEKICHTCDYGFCKGCYPDHKCKLFGAPFLWGCVNHPDIGMKSACKAKIEVIVAGKKAKQVCGLPLCAECWETHSHDSESAT